MTQGRGPTFTRDGWSTLKTAHAWSVDRFGQYLRSPRFWLALGATVGVTSFAGPFDTHDSMSFLRRLTFWTLILIPAVFLQFYLSMTLREFARKKRIAWGYPALLAGILGAGPILALVTVVNDSVVSPDVAFSFTMLVLYVIPMVVSMTVLINAFMPTLQPLWGMRRRRSIRAPLPDVVPPVGVIDLPLPMPKPQPEVSLFFDRLPDDLGCEVICLRAANHHVEVTTALGETRVLMRLSDAEAELSPLPGMRVHRSWWVNMTYVTGSEARAGGLDLILTTGARVPVSRALRSDVEDWLGREAAQ